MSELLPFVEVPSRSLTTWLCPLTWESTKAVYYNEWANFGKKDFEPVYKFIYSGTYLNPT